LRVRVLILGAGGHGQVVADVLLRMEEDGAGITPVGYLDDDATLRGQTLLSLPVIGAIPQVSEIAHEAVIVAIGDNGIRRRLFERLQRQGERFLVARHPSAVIAPDVEVGPGSMICAGAIVNPGSTIGADVILNTGCTVDHHNRIGDHAHIAPGVHLGGEVEIGEGALVGIGATVMPQRRVGRESVVSAGGLVHSDIGDKVVAAGVPARVIRRLS
jgi:sugar O-acyltransferase (sialic acid O-acetyltransferase NeuD family)